MNFKKMIMIVTMGLLMVFTGGPTGRASESTDLSVMKNELIEIAKEHEPSIVAAKLDATVIYEDYYVFEFVLRDGSRKELTIPKEELSEKVLKYLEEVKEENQKNAERIFKNFKVGSLWALAFITLSLFIFIGSIFKK